MLPLTKFRILLDFARKHQIFEMLPLIRALLGAGGFFQFSMLKILAPLAELGLSVPGRMVRVLSYPFDSAPCWSDPEWMSFNVLVLDPIRS